MKRLLVTLITSALAISLMGCGAKESAPVEETKEITVEAEAPSVDTVVEETEKVEEPAAVVEDVVEDVVEIEEVEETAVEAEEPATEVVEEVAAEPATIMEKYGLEITKLNGYCYDDTFIMSEYNKDADENVIMDDYEFFEAPSSACLTEIDNHDGTKTIEAFVEIDFSKWATQYYYYHYDYFLVDLETGVCITGKDAAVIFEGESYATYGEVIQEYSKDYTYGTMRFHATVPEGYNNYALFMRDVVKRDHLVYSLDDIDEISGDNHYVLLQN